MFSDYVHPPFVPWERVSLVCLRWSGLAPLRGTYVIPFIRYVSATLLRIRRGIYSSDCPLFFVQLFHVLDGGIWYFWMKRILPGPLLYNAKMGGVISLYLFFWCRNEHSSGFFFLSLGMLFGFPLDVFFPLEGTDLKAAGNFLDPFQLLFGFLPPLRSRFSFPTPNRGVFRPSQTFPPANPPGASVRLFHPHGAFSR